MIFKVAWRNIWRSRIRSIIVLSSIAIGIWAGLLIIGFSFGMNNERTAAAIGATLGHSQAHSSDFLEDPSPSAIIAPEAYENLVAALEEQPFVTLRATYDAAGNGCLGEANSRLKNHRRKR